MLPLPKSKQPIPAWFEQEINELEKTIDRRLNNNGNKSNQQNGIPENQVDFCGKCSLEFYYNVGTSYRMGIWAKVLNSDGPEIWIRIDVRSNLKRKINVYSKCPLNCIPMDFIKTYALPEDFTPNGIYMSHKGRLVDEMSYDAILNEICALLSCLCTAKCKK